MPRPFQLPDSIFTIEDFPCDEYINLHKGELFLCEREANSGNCYLIVEGALDVRLMTAGGNETLLYTLSAGELVGELSMFLEKRTATIVAAEDCRLLAIRPAVFWACFEREDFRLRITSLFLSRYLRSHDVICRLGQPSVTRKVCCYLLALPEWKDCKDGVLLVSLPTREVMAHLLSCQRETISRAFRKVVMMGLVEQESRQMYRLHKQRLASFLDDA